jgi:hypothetical protein
MKYLIALLFLSAACSASERDLLGEAQICLDQAQPQTAQSCIDPIRSVHTREAEVLKCGAGFITEGFKDGTRILKAYRQMADPKQGTLSFFGTMTFSSHPNSHSNRSFAREVDMHCQASGQPVYNMLSAISLAATTLSAAGGVDWSLQEPPTREEVLGAINTLRATKGSPQTVEAVREVGSALVRMFEKSCLQTKLRPTVLCRQIDAALRIAGGNKDTETTADRLLDIWSQ